MSAERDGPVVHELQERVGLGEDIEAFLNGRVVKTFLSRQEQRRAELVEALIEANPHDIVQVQSLQNEIKRIDDFASWLAEGIQDAESALKLLEQAGFTDATG